MLKLPHFSASIHGYRISQKYYYYYYYYNSIAIEVAIANLKVVMVEKSHFHYKFPPLSFRFLLFAVRSLFSNTLKQQLVIE